MVMVSKVMGGLVWKFVFDEDRIEILDFRFCCFWRQVFLRFVEELLVCPCHDGPSPPRVTAPLLAGSCR